MSSKLNGKVVIITGAFAGVSESTAIALAIEGAKVALVACGAIAKPEDGKI